jgi:septal ring factor EnvC (AmiA/AmiB activator)
MSEQGEDPAERIERSTQQLEQDLDRLEHHIDDAKDQLKERQADAERLERAEDVAGDWEEKRPDPDRPQGDDPAD